MQQPRIRGLTVYTGVWLKAKKTEITIGLMAQEGLYFLLFRPFYLLPSSYLLFLFLSLLFLRNRNF